MLALQELSLQVQLYGGALVGGWIGNDWVRMEWKTVGDVGLRGFLNIQSYKLDLIPQATQRKEVAMRNNVELRSALG